MELKEVEQFGYLERMQILPMMWLQQLFWWSELDWPGNPHRPGTANERSIKLRALATQAADMMMIDDLHSKSIGRRSDFLGGTMLNWVYVYYHSKELLPESVQEAFEAGFTRMVEKMEIWGSPRREYEHGHTGNTGFLVFG